MMGVEVEVVAFLERQLKELFKRQTKEVILQKCPARLDHQVKSYSEFIASGPQTDHCPV